MTAGHPVVLAPGPSSAPLAGAPPTFTVLIAVLEARYLAEAVRSAVEQTVACEVIVVDDGSTDDVAATLAPFAERVTMRRQANRGAAAARNAALELATGDWVVVLDADDVFLPGRIEALGRAAQQRPDLGLLTTDAWLVRDGRALRRCYSDGYGFELGDQRAAIIRGNFVYGMVAMRRDLAQRLGGFDETLRHAEDWELVARALLSGARAGLVPAPLVRYRIHSASKSASAVNRARGAVGVLERVLGGAPLRPAERRLAEHELRRRRGELALAEAKEALRTATPRRRALSWRAARAPALSVATRAKAAATAVAPGLAARLHADGSAASAELTGGLA